MMAQRSTFLAQMNKSQDDARATKWYRCWEKTTPPGISLIRTPEGPSQKLPSKEQYEE